jgi:hypothetical protein
MFKTMSFAAFALMASVSFAQAADHAAKTAANSPCASVMQACKQAGYTRGGMKTGKGLIANCVKPLEDGQSVSGVTVDKASIDACKADHLAKKAQFDEKMKNDPEFAKKVEARKAVWAAKRNEKEAQFKALTEKTTP